MHLSITSVQERWLLLLVDTLDCFILCSLTAKSWWCARNDTFRVCCHSWQIKTECFGLLIFYTPPIWWTMADLKLFITKSISILNTKPIVWGDFSSSGMKPGNISNHLTMYSSLGLPSLPLQEVAHFHSKHHSCMLGYSNPELAKSGNLKWLLWNHNTI